MRLPRLKARPQTEAFYHLTTRCAFRELAFGDIEKSAIVSTLWRVATFSGIQILNYCVMTNHIHILVRVPAQSSEIPAEELLRRYAVLYGEKSAARLAEKWTALDLSALEATQTALRRRMGDITPFMQNLKQRVTIEYNATHANASGTLWQGRFHSTLVEPGQALRTVSAYIDFNPVRSGMATQPEKYAYSARGASARGDASARAAIAALDSIDHAAASGKPPDLEPVTPSADFLLQHHEAFSRSSIIGSGLFIEDNHSPYLKALGRRRPIPTPAPLHDALPICVPGTFRNLA